MSNVEHLFMCLCGHALLMLYTFLRTREQKLSTQLCNSEDVRAGEMVLLGEGSRQRSLADRLFSC